jgi:glycosyltransferase involved in cell wall biosynthesis
MKILVITQMVDANHPVLGFFHRWIEEFAHHCDAVHVLCLEEGKRDLPKNVYVHSLGKERGASRLTRLTRFYLDIWSLRQEYDAVFVHMNPVYVVLGGMLWRLLGKKVSLWYTHGTVTTTLRMATLLTHTIFTASAGSFRIKSKKVQVVGHGIDTDLFKPLPIPIHTPIHRNKSDLFLWVASLVSSVKTLQ